MQDLDARRAAADERPRLDIALQRTELVPAIPRSSPMSTMAC